jgi:hypothetical protein
MPSNEESASANRERDRETAAGENAKSASPDQQADSTEQVQEEALYLRQVLLGLANEIIFALGADPDTTSMPRFDRGPHSGEVPPGPMMRRRLQREWDYRTGPPPRRGMPPPWFGNEGAMGGPPGGRRRGGRVDEGEEGR